MQFTNFYKCSNLKTFMEKRGQFFILAAVIISSVIVGLAGTANYVKTNQVPENFYALNSEINSESNKVIDYVVYNEESDRALEDFISKVAENILDQDPDTELYFIYGDTSSVTVNTDYAKEGGSAEASSEISLQIGDRVFEKTTRDKANTYRSYVSIVPITPEMEEKITLHISEKEYDFPLRENLKIISVIKKEIKNETYINIK